MEYKHETVPSVHVSGSEETLEARAYETPEVQTFTSEQLLEVLGPAQGYGGTGSPGRRNGNSGRGHRLFPGLR